MGKTAKYVLDLIEQILGPAEREKRFDWARGDLSPRTKRALPLPFDAAWEGRKLIIEIDEDQHREATPIFDKPDRLTVSGVHRGKQRQLYDERKRAAARANGYTVLSIPWARKRKPSPQDAVALRRQLLAAGIVIETDDSEHTSISGESRSVKGDTR